MVAVGGQRPWRAMVHDVHRAFGIATALAALFAVGGVSVEAAEVQKGWRIGEFRDVEFKDPAALRAVAIQPLKIDQVAVIRSKVRPGDQAALEAAYTVAVPAGTLNVRETRIVEFNGTRLATRERVVARRPGQVRSEVPLSIPEDAVPGGYTVTTIVEPVASTRGVTMQREQTMFVVEATGGSPRPPPPTATPSPPGDPLRVELWAAKNDYRIGEKVTFYFQTNRDAYVTLINKGTSGKVTVLYPNPYAPDEKIKAGTRYAVPGPEVNYELPISGPPGEEMVWAVATLKPVRPGARGPAPTDVSVLTRDINVQAAGMPPAEQAQATVVLKVAE